MYKYQIRIFRATIFTNYMKASHSSLITHSVKQFYFAVVWLGQNHIIGNSSSFIEEYDFKQMQIEITEAFNNSQMLVVHPTKIFLNNLHHTLHCGHWLVLAQISLMILVCIEIDQKP